jgi:anhydro-N-acetylmuramic acid kinase
VKVLGLISGTSHDGIDAALVDFRLEGTTLHGRLLQGSTTAYDVRLRRRLLSALPPAATTFAEVCELDTLIGIAFAEAAEALVSRSGPVDAVCSHGQTVFHWVEQERARGTLQIGQPAWIAERLGTPVVADLRIRDLTAGGQGAPLVSHLDTLLLAGLPGRPAALNLGGIANMTVPGAAGGPLAYDIGPANALVDAAVLRTGAHPAGYDEDGAIAAAGRVDTDLLVDLLREPYYRLAAPKSTGKELFNDDYVTAAVQRHGRQLAPADLIATLTALTARTVADAAREHRVDTLVASGGGCANRTLLRMLTDELPGVRVMTSDELGAPSDLKEAIAFALIGWQTLHGLPATVATCTGARDARILGSITPGRGPLRLPAPISTAPTGLRLTVEGSVA